MRIELTQDERDRLYDLLIDQRDETVSGDRSGYGQDQTDEVDDINALLLKLRG